MTSGETWNIKEVIEVTPCGDTTLKYFDPDLSPMVEIDATLIASIKNEGKCECDCTPPVVVGPVLPPLEQRKAYGTSFIGGVFPDKFAATTDMQWQIKVIKNGVDVLNTPVSPILSTIAAAQAWANSAAQGYFTIDSIVPNPKYSMADNSGTDEWLVIITETVGAAAGLNSPQTFSFTNRGISLGAGGDYADSIGTPLTWANRAAFTWYIA